MMLYLRLCGRSKSRRMWLLRLQNKLALTPAVEAYLICL